MKHTLRMSFAIVGVAVALIAVAVYSGSSAGALMTPIFFRDIAVIAILGGLAVLVTATSPKPWVRLLPWVTCGALLAPAIIATGAMAPVLGVAAIAFGAAGVTRGTGRGRALILSGTAALTAAVVNLGVLYTFPIQQPMRISFTELQSKDFRAHSLLADVPLLDSWVIHLRGGGDGRTLRDIDMVRSASEYRRASPIVIGLLGLRWIMGSVFRWDHDGHHDPDASYVTRLTDSDRSESLEEPGTRMGDSSFRIVYAFEREALYEIVNGTVHAFWLWAMEPAEDGYSLYWAFYVKDISWITPYYMGFITPFRRRVVYPDFIRRLERAWQATWTEQGTGT